MRHDDRRGLEGSSAMIRVLLADDHAVVRDGLRVLLEAAADIEVIGDAGNGREALRLARQQHPDVIVMDIAMPEMNGVEATEQLQENAPAARVVILSMHADATFVRQALRAGVAGYLLKGAAVAELPLALQSVIRGETYLTPKVSQHVIDGYLREETGEDPGPLEELTARQREILQLLAEGRSTKEIAGILDVSVKTVETHRMRLMDRLGIHDLPGLVRFAIRAGIVSPAE